MLQQHLNWDIKHPFLHYQQFGEGENRPPSLEFFGFDEELYLSLNEDVAAAVLNGTFISALHHYIAFGQREFRDGSGIGRVSFEFSKDIDTLIGTSGNDTFVADETFN